MRVTEYLGDVGGQKTLRSYWRNYFEKTDALIWVVDATDRLRVSDCRDELHSLLQEEVSVLRLIYSTNRQTDDQLALGGREFVDIRKQNGRGRMHGRARDPESSSSL